MRPSEALAAHRSEIRRVVEAHRARNPRVFGSVSRASDTESSDLDLLIDTVPETSLLDLGAMLDELETLLGVRVDILTSSELPPAFQRHLLTQAIPV
jgi:predicted nucleotidyltransferase